MNDNTNIDYKKIDDIMIFQLECHKKDLQEKAKEVDEILNSINTKNINEEDLYKTQKEVNRLIREAQLLRTEYRKQCLAPFESQRNNYNKNVLTPLKRMRSNLSKKEERVVTQKTKIIEDYINYKNKLHKIKFVSVEDVGLKITTRSSIDKHKKEVDHYFEELIGDNQ